MTTNEKELWETYKTRELSILTPILLNLGFELESDQPHLIGERYLMHAVTTKSGKKLILLGKRISDGKRVIIKATRDIYGIREIEHERLCRRLLQEIKFAYKTFLSPEELLFTKKDSFVISIQTFIEQESTFLNRPLPQQFSLALKAFKAQEAAHAATYEHARRIAKTFGAMDAEKYLSTFSEFVANILSTTSGKPDLENALREAQTRLEENKNTIQQYAHFLTHTDFVPHNFRIVGEDIYLLDYSSLRFGNKYEGWARFLNFMTLYNPDLEKALVTYVRENRTHEESESLKLMRLYRLGEIIWYYTRALEKSTDELLVLNKARAEFWTEVLKAQLKDIPLDEKILTAYKIARDALRSDDEKKRQKDLH